MNKLALAAFALVAAPAPAHDWRTVSHSADGDQTAIDAGTLVRSGNRVTFSVNSVFGTVSHGVKRYTAKRVGDCSSMSFIDMQTSYYGPNQNLLGTTQQDRDVTRATPHTVNYTILQAACSIQRR